MAFNQFLRDYKTAYRHQGGVRSLPLGRLDPRWFAQLQKEMSWIIAEQASSNVADAMHTTNWTRPIGEARQYSLYNPSGKSDDYLSDFIPPGAVKRQLVFPQLAATTRFAKLFGDELINLRLNGLGKGSQLSLHEENSIAVTPAGRVYRIRMHLPVFTNPAAEMLLDGQSFHYQEGTLYFFHRGCVHAALNPAEMPRYHLVLDCLLNRALHERLFPGAGASPEAGFVRFTPAQARENGQGRASPVTEFVTEDGRRLTKIDYGRQLPSIAGWYRKNYPSAFRPLDAVMGSSARAG